MKPLIILDRDGVINEDSVNYIRSPEEWGPLHGSLEAIAELSGAGYSIAVATNQAGVAKKVFSQDILDAIHQKMLSQVAAKGGHIARIFFCPHHPDDRCSCRKPEPGMLLDACKAFHVEPSQAFFIGDSLRDIQAAIKAGCRAVLVLTGNGRKTLADLDARTSAQVVVFNSLSEFASALLSTDGRLEVTG